MNNRGLVEHCIMALDEKWGYVYGTFGLVLTEALLRSKIDQYPNQVKNYEPFIRDHWMGKRVVDCIGLIKSYLWWNNGNVKYSAGTDVNANGMYGRAAVKGPIETIPDIPGICVWKNLHIGIYVGKGKVVESFNTVSGVIKTPLEGEKATEWTHWLKCPFIKYETETRPTPVYRSVQ